MNGHLDLAFECLFEAQFEACLVPNDSFDLLSNCSEIVSNQICQYMQVLDSSSVSLNFQYVRLPFF